MAGTRGTQGGVGGMRVRRARSAPQRSRCSEPKHRRRHSDSSTIPVSRNLARRATASNILTGSKRRKVRRARTCWLLTITDKRAAARFFRQTGFLDFHACAPVRFRRRRALNAVARRPKFGHAVINFTSCAHQALAESASFAYQFLSKTAAQVSPGTRGRNG